MLVPIIFPHLIISLSAVLVYSYSNSTKQSDITYLEPDGGFVTLKKKIPKWFHFLCQSEYPLKMAPRLHFYILHKNYLNN